MDISNKIMDEIRLSDINVYDDIPNSFKCAININPLFKNEIDDIYKRTLLNYGKTTLSAFHLKYMEMFNLLAQHYKEDNEELLDFANSLITIINLYFKELNSNLNIKTQRDLEELKYILGISLILMQEVVEDKSIELAYESFFQIERRIEKHNLYKKAIHILNNDGYEIKIFTQDQTEDYENNSITNLTLKEYDSDNLRGIEYEL